MKVVFKKLLLPVLIAAALPMTAQAQDDEEGAKVLDAIAVTGSRAKFRTVEDSPVPVDIINTDDLINTGATELGRALQILAPSFNFSSSSISDGSDALRPATLRGLGPDQTLVLVNGKRRHNSALIHVNTSVGRGTAGTDLNAIPISAIDHVEVLRDGAAAQYGSDAIAGVINIVLRSSSTSGFVGFEAGQTYDGDGTTYIANANNGFAIGDGGFLNMTYEYRKRDATNRAGLSGKRQYPCTDGVNIDYSCTNITTLDPREATFNRKNFRIGDSDSEQNAFIANFAMPIGEGELYSFFTYSDRENQSGGFYRAASDSTKTILSDYPDGFLPLINTTIEDWSGFGGYRFTIGGWDYDASIGKGRNKFNFFISNSQNASLGPGSQTSANAGDLYLTQTTANFDATKVFYNNDRALNVAWGAEYRMDTYRIIPGEQASYADGGAVNPVTGAPYATGFQVFRGFSPRNAVEEDRDSYAFYLDIESQLTDKFLLAGALRYEDFSDFGSTVIGKLSGRYQINDAFALRASGSTGFRAPSMQQQFFNSISTQFVSNPNGGGLIAEERGTFRNDSDVAAAVGIPQLKEEESVNLSFGFTFNPANNWEFSADYYYITIDDRIVLSGAIKTSNPLLPPSVVDGMNDLGITSAQFFTNAGTTDTQGIDLVATWNTEFSNGASYEFAGAANWTETDVGKGVNTSGLPDGLADVLFTSQDRSIIEEWQPTTHMSLTNTFRQNAWTGVLQASYFGEYTVQEGNGDRQKFGGKMLFDVAVSYDVANTGFLVTLGVNNLFNTTPDKNKIGQSRGGTIPGIVDSEGVFKFSRRSAPFGFNGGYYYIKGVYRF